MTRPSGARGETSEMILLVGGDIGGTRARIRTRLLRAADDVGAEEIRDREGPGYNPNSTDPAAGERLLDLVAAAIRDDLPAADGPVRTVVVLGIAGAGPARNREVAEAVRRGLTARAPVEAGDVHVVDDMVTAFASGEVGPDGLLLLAGTGAAAARFRDHRGAGRVDGMGWLLGDEGSAVWLGRRVLQAVAADLDGRGPRTALTRPTAALLGLADPGPDRRRDVRQAMIAAVAPMSPADWGRFATIPQDHVADPVAAGMLHGAAEALLRAVDLIRTDADTRVVLTGSVLQRNPVVARRVREGLEQRGLAGSIAAEPVRGALLLAGRMVTEGV